MFDTTARQSRICISKTAAIRTKNFGEVDLHQIDKSLDDVLKSSISIGGVVFFGSGKVARNVLERSNRFYLAQLPRFILTGTIGLQTDTFQSVNRDDVLTKTLGSLVVVPAFTEIKSYIDYRNSLQTNSAELGQELLHAKYGIIAAHAIAKVTKQEFLNQCNSAQCVRQIQPSTLINRMNAVTLDLHSDFNTSVQPLARSKYGLQYSNSPDPVYLSDHDVYQVYVFKQNATNQPELNKVISYFFRQGNTPCN